MRAVVFYLLLALQIQPSEAALSARLLKPDSAKKIETAYHSLQNPKSDEWKLQRNQVFEVQLNQRALKKIVFAPFVNYSVRFVLLTEDGKSIVQTLPKSQLAVTTIFAFEKVEAVSFKDLNADGTLDILVLTTYFDSRPVQGEGVGGGSTKIGYVYLSRGETFEINEDCGEDVASIKALETCVRKALKSK